MVRACTAAAPRIRLGQRRPDFRIHQACPDGHRRETLGRESPGGSTRADGCQPFNVRELLAAARSAGGGAARDHHAERRRAAGAPRPRPRRGGDRRRLRGVPPAGHRGAPAGGQGAPGAPRGRCRARAPLRARGGARVAAAAPQRGVGAGGGAARGWAAVLRDGAAPRLDAGRAGAGVRASPHRGGAPPGRTNPRRPGGAARRRAGPPRSLAGQRLRLPVRGRGARGDPRSRLRPGARGRRGGRAHAGQPRLAGGDAHLHGAGAGHARARHHPAERPLRGGGAPLLRVLGQAPLPRAERFSTSSSPWSARRPSPSAASAGTPPPGSTRSSAARWPSTRTPASPAPTRCARRWRGSSLPRSARASSDPASPVPGEGFARPA